MKDIFRWYSPHVEQEIQLARWGHMGKPVILFPTAGGDAEEIERFLMVSVLQPLIEAGRVKIYSTDSVAGKAWISKKHSAQYCAKLQNMFDALVYHEIVPAIRADCQSPDIEIIAAGASIGAFNSVASVCRHPDAFSMAIAMSGSYDLLKLLAASYTQEFYFCSPMHYLPGLEGPLLEKLQTRFILMPSGEGDYENIGESWQMARILGDKRIPNRVDSWGTAYKHDWETWREMLPQYLAQYC